MNKNWLIRGVCLAFAAMSLAGCVVVPERPYHPVYFYR